MEKVLKFGRVLAASGGEEFDIDLNDDPTMTRAERLAKQVRNGARSGQGMGGGLSG